METSMQDLSEIEPLLSQEAHTEDDYTEEIHQHLRKSEVCSVVEAFKDIHLYVQ